VGFVFQSFLLLPSLTALDNVLLAGKYVGAAKAESRRRAQALLEQFGVLARRAHYPRELSGGEQQRVAFCRAIFNDPPLLLADEPTGNLDDDNAALIAKALRERAAAGGAVVVVTHRPDAVAGAQVVYALENGRLRKVS
jgi:ABC-type lipoprotein export system ATPase subunit